MYSVTTLKVKRGHFKNYCYLIVDEATKAAALVDPAWDLDQILAAIHEQGANLKTILLTHSHFDHVNLVEPLAELFQPEVFISRLEAETYGFGCSRLNLLEDGAQFQLGVTSICALLTPGHTAGGICYLLENDLFSGDTIFVEGCGICDLEGGSPSQMFESINRIRKVVALGVRLRSGHCYGKEPGLTFEEVIDANIYFHFEREAEFIKFRMRNSDLKPFRFR